jgi:hypothetical protein
MMVLSGYFFLSGFQTGNTLFDPVFAQSQPNGPPPLKPIVGTEKASPIVLMKVERLPTPVKVGDAEAKPDSIKVISEPVSEECCNIIQYTPGPSGKGGLAYQAEEDYDLTNAKRVVFFAKGENGGERITFVVAGRDLDAGVTLPGAIFKNQKFTRTTQDVVLDKIWKRYEISLEGVDLKAGVKYPFGFVVMKGQNQQAVVFSVRDITFDAESPKSPLPLSTDTPSIASSTMNNGTDGNNTQNFALTTPEQILQENDTDASTFLNGVADTNVTDNNITTPATIDDKTQFESSPQQLLNPPIERPLISEADNTSNQTTSFQSSRSFATPFSSLLSTPQTQNELYVSPPTDIADTNIADLLTAPTAPTAPIQESPSPLVIPQPFSFSDPSLDTIIASVVDNATGVNIQNGGAASSSSSIAFMFGGSGNSAYSGYLCSIDGLQAFYCESPVIVNINELQAAGVTGDTGSHIFQVSAIDASGKVDSSPAVFNWLTTPISLRAEVLPQTTFPPPQTTFPPPQTTFPPPQTTFPPPQTTFPPTG